MRWLLSLVVLLALGLLALACSPPYRPSDSYTPPVNASEHGPGHGHGHEEEDVVIFTFFQVLSAVQPVVTPTAPPVAPAPTTAPVTSPTVASGTPDDGPPLLVSSSAATRPPVAGTGSGGVEVLRANCANCHGNGKSSGGVVIFDATGNYNPNRDVGDLYDAVAEGAMPPGKKLSVSERKSLRQLLARQ